MDVFGAIFAAALLLWAQTHRADAADRRADLLHRAGGLRLGHAVPDGFPPYVTVYRWFARFRDDCTWERINHDLVRQDRERVGRQASPSAAVLDSQSAIPREAGGPGGHDAGKKVKGRKRHALVDTDGTLITIGVHPADIQDRDEGAALLKPRVPHSPLSNKSLPTPPMLASGWRMQPASPSK